MSKELVPVFSRDVIIEAIAGHRAADPLPGSDTPEYLADLIIGALAKKCLHIFTFKAETKPTKEETQNEPTS